MSDTEDQKAPTPPPMAAFANETREQRLMKYGANVVLSSVLVIVLAVIVVFAAQKWSFRKAVGGADSVELKPQTVSIIKEIDDPIKIVDLYSKLDDPNDKDRQDQYQRIIDTLDEYHRKGKNIDFEVIDPVKEPIKVDQWLGEVTRKYGGNVEAHRVLLVAFPKTLKELEKLPDAEVVKLKQIPGESLGKLEDDDMDTLRGTMATVLQFPRDLKSIEAAIAQELKQKLPNYKGAVTALRESLSDFSSRTGAVRTAMEKLGKSETAPKDVRDYASGSVERFAEMKKVADDEVAKIKALGELKVNDVYQRLSTQQGQKPAPAIAVMGKDDIKLIDVEDLWKSGESTNMVAATSAHPDDKPKFRFTGEQRITSAILALSKPEKPLVVFVRGGGQAKISGGMMGAGPYSDIADRLRTYNYEVKEKDVSGQAMQQAMMQQQPPPEEASDEEMKNAVWVVFAEPTQSQFGMMPSSPAVAKKLKEHLDAGGSAIAMISLKGDDLADALKDWGVQAKPNMIAVHDPILTDTDAGQDFIEAARRRPWVFVINQFGGPHPITDPIQSLDAAVVPMIPILKIGAPDATITQLLPVPTQVPAWGESDTSFLFDGKGLAPTFDEGGDDIKSPLFCGAAVERKGKGRLVVLGAASLVRDDMLSIPDPKLLATRGITVVRFPANGELFMNSIFWLGKQEKLIALSPAAMDTARIQPIGVGMLNFWKYGVILLGLPLLAIVGGAVVWQRRSNES